jgi:TPR repeat protein
MGVIRLLIVFFSALLFSLGAATAGDYEDGGAAYDRGDFATAKRLWLPLAEQGDAKAQTGLALMYFLGQGVDMNLAAALDWCSKAAEHGLPTAQFLLGQIYQHPWDPEIRDLGTAFKWYSKAAAQGYADAQDEIGGMYEFGLGVPTDYAEAEKWFAKANDLLAIAIMYDRVARNRPLAAKWYRKLADQGDKFARFRLGEMYRDGEGVQRDYAAALRWFNLAAASGYPYGSAARDELARKMTPAQIAKTLRLRQDWKDIR